MVIRLHISQLMTVTYKTVLVDHRHELANMLPTNSHSSSAISGTSSHWLFHANVPPLCTSLQTDNYASTPPHSFLQAGCPSCRPTNSVKALKGKGKLLSYYDSDCNTHPWAQAAHSYSSTWVFKQVKVFRLSNKWEWQVWYTQSLSQLVCLRVGGQYACIRWVCSQQVTVLGNSIMSTGNGATCTINIVLQTALISILHMKTRLLGI